MESANGENNVAPVNEVVENAIDVVISNKVEEDVGSSTTEVDQPSDNNNSKKQTKGSSSKNNKPVKNVAYVGTFGRTPRATNLSQSLSFPTKLRESVNRRSSSGLKPIKTEVLIKDDDAASSTDSPNAPSSGRRRNSTSSFSFRLDERAERRKQFYSKVEEKIQAKEIEKTTLQAKSKESHDEEIKKLRKSLTFKATPMPNFYNETLAKPQLKKIPTTRAISPKFKSGRTRSSNKSMEHIEISESPRAAKDQTMSPRYRDNNTAAFKKPNGKSSLTKMSEVKTSKLKEKVLKSEDDKEDKASNEQVRGSQVPYVSQNEVEACLEVNEVN